MTRRVIVYKRGNLYFVSQEFNGDYEESKRFNLQSLPWTAAWNRVIDYFYGNPDTLANFKASVRHAETLYGYDHEKLIETNELPLATYDEIWIFTKNGLELFKEEI